MSIRAHSRGPARARCAHCRDRRATGRWRGGRARFRPARTPVKAVAGTMHPASRWNACRAPWRRRTAKPPTGEARPVPRCRPGGRRGFAAQVRVRDDDDVEQPEDHHHGVAPGGRANGVTLALRQAPLGRRAAGRLYGSRPVGAATLWRWKPLQQGVRRSGDGLSTWLGRTGEGYAGRPSPALYSYTESRRTVSGGKCCKNRSARSSPSISLTW